MTFLAKDKTDINNQLTRPRLLASATLIYRPMHKYEIILAITKIISIDLQVRKILKAIILFWLDSRFSESFILTIFLKSFYLTNKNFSNKKIGFQQIFKLKTNYNFYQQINSMTTKTQKQSSVYPATRRGNTKPIKKTEKRSPAAKKEGKWKQEPIETSTSLPQVESEQEQTRMVEIELWSQPHSLTLWEEVLGAQFNMIF